MILPRKQLNCGMKGRMTMAEWISVKDRLPECDKRVLARDRWGTFVGFYAENADAEGNHWIADDDNVYVYDKDVLQWMYIPELPKGEHE